MRDQPCQPSSRRLHGLGGPGNSTLGARISQAFANASSSPRGSGQVTKVQFLFPGQLAYSSWLKAPGKPPEEVLAFVSSGVVVTCQANTPEIDTVWPATSFEGGGRWGGRALYKGSLGLGEGQRCRCGNSCHLPEYPEKIVLFFPFFFFLLLSPSLLKSMRRGGWGIGL